MRIGRVLRPSRLICGSLQAQWRRLFWLPKFNALGQFVFRLGRLPILTSRCCCCCGYGAFLSLREAGAIHTEA
jgi:hypothetical protein